ncbi:MAG: hypothetical protein F4X91_04635 [Nitrospinae bacterium]|nr:hypothetical protein [Nitrospinota bacterium]
MTEFEIATLEFTRISLWISAIHAFISLIVGAGQCALILYGLRLMQRGSERREEQSKRQHEETMADLDTRHRESMRALEARHRESMRALEALIERTAK